MHKFFYSQSVALSVCISQKGGAYVISSPNWQLNQFASTEIDPRLPAFQCSCLLSWRNQRIPLSSISVTAVFGLTQHVPYESMKIVWSGQGSQGSYTSKTTYYRCEDALGGAHGKEFRLPQFRGIQFIDSLVIHSCDKVIIPNDTFSGSSVQHTIKAWPTLLAHYSLSFHMHIANKALFKT